MPANLRRGFGPCEWCGRKIEEHDTEDLRECYDNWKANKKT